MWRVRHLWSIQDCRRASKGASYRGRASGCSGVLQEFIISDIDEAADLLYMRKDQRRCVREDPLGVDQRDVCYEKFVCVWGSRSFVLLDGFIIELEL